MAMSIKSFEKFCQLYGVVEKGEIEEVGEMISRNVTAYKAEPLERPHNEIRAQIACATTQDISLVYLDWSAPSIGMSLAKQDDFNLRITLRGEVCTTDPYLGQVSAEKEIGHARIFSLTEDTRTYSKGHTAVNLVIPHARLEERAKSYYQNQLDKPLRFAPTMNLSTVQGQSISALIEYFMSLHNESAQCFDNPIVRAQFRELMFSNIIGGMEHNYADVFNKGASDVAIPRIVKRAEDYMRANADKPVTIERLAREAGCSERALQYGFKEFRHKSPLTVLRDIRLENAFDDLVQASGSVTEIAFRWGFGNLGRFSRLFEEK
ncbi:AraC family transcriptional regulator, partial [Hoeflea poritis]